ncbi:hypothetical protein AAY473_024119 [Plecturocebus cupreus]
MYFVRRTAVLAKTASPAKTSAPLKLECSSGISAHSNLCLPDESDSPASASQTGFHLYLKKDMFPQAGLELLDSSDPPASGSQGAWITSVSHLTWPDIILIHLACDYVVSFPTHHSPTNSPQTSEPDNWRHEQDPKLCCSDRLWWKPGWQ